MTAAALSLRSGISRTCRVLSLIAVGRLLRLEFRRNTMIWMLLPLAALIWYDPYRVAMEYAPVWDLRASVMLDHFVPLAAFGAGVAAWMGSREGRRHTTDLVTATARPGWARHVVTWAATTCWVITAYLGFVAALYVATAAQATWGSPPWWPVAVGAMALAAVCALGFAAGVFFPGRFTAPLAALGAFVVSLQGVSHDTNPYAQLSGTTGVPPADIGVFYRDPPDLAIVQVMFLAGLAVAALGALGLPAASSGQRLRGAAAVVTAVGLAAAGTAAGLAGTAVPGAYGLVIPALHDEAGDRPLPYRPACADAPVPVCVHPAFRAYLAGVTTALDPVLREVAGLPGAPVRAEQAATSDLSGFSWGADLGGTPAVFRFALPATSPSFISGLQDTFLITVIAGGDASDSGGTPAQQAVESALLTATGGQPQSGQPPMSPAVSAAASRFAALPAAARHTWLAVNLPALRAGHVALAQLP